MTVTGELPQEWAELREVTICLPAETLAHLAGDVADAAYRLHDDAARGRLLELAERLDRVV